VFIWRLILILLLLLEEFISLLELKNFARKHGLSLLLLFFFSSFFHLDTCPFFAILFLLHSHMNLFKYKILERITTRSLEHLFWELSYRFIFGCSLLV
jgi:hypothetical protein